MEFWITEIFRWSVLLGAFFAAIYYYPSLKNSEQKYFLHFLAYVVLTELVASLCVNVFHYSSDAAYNIYIVLSMLFYLFWLRSIVKKKVLINILIIVFCLVCIYTFFTQSIVTTFWGEPLIIGSVFILLASFLFFKELIEKEEVIDFLKSQQFWIVVGLLLFYIGFLPVYFLMKYLDQSDIRINMVIPVLNMLLYGSFIIGFRCRSK